MITLEEFQKLDLRIVRVRHAERVDGSEKLLKLHLETGSLDEGGSRQVLSGIAKQYTPEELIGRQVVIIANLEPRMMMGMESQGMLLAAHGTEGEPVILLVEKEVPNGSKVS